MTKLKKPSGGAIIYEDKAGELQTSVQPLYATHFAMTKNYVLWIVISWRWIGIVSKVAR